MEPNFRISSLDSASSLGFFQHSVMASITRRGSWTIQLQADKSWKVYKFEKGNCLPATNTKGVSYPEITAITVSSETEVQVRNFKVILVSTCIGAWIK